MSREMQPRTVRNYLLANVIRCENNERPGLRINWNKTLCGGLMLLLFGLWNITSASLSLAAMLTFLCFGILAGAVAYQYIQEKEYADARDEEVYFPKGWFFGAIVVGLLLCGGEIFLVDHGLHYIWSGLLLFGFLVCLVGVSVTRWWTFGRPIFNRSRIEPKKSRV